MNMLDKDIKQQLEQYLALLENDIVIKASVGDDINHPCDWSRQGAERLRTTN